MKKLFFLCLICLLAVSAMAQNSGWVDLGLPSGTLWKMQNESGYYNTYEEALNRFGSKLPERHHFIELINECTWIWIHDYGYKVIGPNGNSITLPAAGYCDCFGDVGRVGTYGYYWSSTPYDSEDSWYLSFDSSGVYMYYYNRCEGRSVRLVQ